MPVFVVGACHLADAGVWLSAETTADVVGCSGCGTRAVGHGRSTTLIPDLPIAGRPTVLCSSKRRWRCPGPDCETKAWSEVSPESAPRAVLTERTRKQLAEMVNVGPDSVAKAAAVFGVG